MHPRPVVARVGTIAAGLALLGACSVPAQQPGPLLQQEAPSSPGSPAATPATRDDHVELALTVHPAATEAAMDVLADGGTAADASVAAAAVLSVVEPHFSNLIAGETSALYRDAGTGSIQSLSAVGYVGAEYTQEEYEQRGTTGYGLYQSLVPGAWDGWMLLLAEHGELGLDRVLEPAIALARDGHQVSDDLAARLAVASEFGGVNETAAALYLPGGEPLEAGDEVVQADFARTLQTISDSYAATGSREEGLQEARDVVYRGEVGQQVVEAIQADGGYVTEDDLAGFEAELDASISMPWDDEVTVHQNPPPSQGLTMLAALNTLREADLSAGPDDPGTVHQVIEAVKLAMADREAYIGDPDLTEAPVAEALSPEYGQAQLARIQPDTALEWPIDDGLTSMNNTTTFQIVDAAGNAAAVTTSTGYQFVTAGDTGIMMDNRMRFMTAEDEESPNHLEPGTQVRYTGNPWMATRGDDLWLMGGTIGADVQSQVQTQHFLGVAEFGLDVSEAVARPRFVTESVPNSIVPHEAPNVINLEEGYPEAVREGLLASGQDVVPGSAPGAFGYGTVVELAADGSDATLGTDARVATSTGETRTP